jgi:4-hydroxy 2-oxovalerate aldolase
MNKICLLDCTLRDGGFINNWDFGETAIRNLYCGLVDARVDIIELGYIRKGTIYDRNRSVFSCTQDARWILEGKSAPNTMKVMILDYGQCQIDEIGRRDERDVDGIRVTFKKENIDSALELCRQIQQRGYKVFAQPVSITDYSDLELLALLKKLEEMRPYAVSIVDTYGFMQKDDVMHLYTLFDRNLPAEIVIGYHAHNNFQLAYSNAVALIEQHTQRKIIIDASLYGMGKSAGNAGLELLMNYCNLREENKYDLSIASELIDTEISKYQQDGEWGYSFLYYLAAVYRCHPKYVDHLIKKKTISVRSIARILQFIPTAKRTSFDRDYIENAYAAAQLRPKWDDKQSYDRLLKKIGGRAVLIVATGNSVRKSTESIKEYIHKTKPYVIHLNRLYDGIPADAIFFKNEKRYQRYHREKNNMVSCLLASNMPDAKASPEGLFCIGNAVKTSAAIDNTTLVLLYILVHAGQKKIAVAGMDGFCAGTENFSDKYQFMGGDPAAYGEINQKAQKCLNELSEMAELFFITPSLYKL